LLFAHKCVLSQINKLQNSEKELFIFDCESGQYTDFDGFNYSMLDLINIRLLHENLLVFDLLNFQGGLIENVDFDYVFITDKFIGCNIFKGNIHYKIVFEDFKYKELGDLVKNINQF
jgi:hypothetical protein